MAITIGEAIQNRAVDSNFNQLPNIDAKYGPYATIAAALSSITSTNRAVGLTVGIKTGNDIIEYWFNGGIADSNLVEKDNASSGGIADEKIVSKLPPSGIAPDGAEWIMYK